MYANEATKLALEQRTAERVKFDLDVVLSHIESNAKRGHYTCQLLEATSDSSVGRAVAEKLIELGYKVSYKRDDQGYNRTHVSWHPVYVLFANAALGDKVQLNQAIGDIYAIGDVLTISSICIVNGLVSSITANDATRIDSEFVNITKSDFNASKVFLIKA
jgi:hypothetical protein